MNLSSIKPGRVTPEAIRKAFELLEFGHSLPIRKSIEIMPIVKSKINGSLNKIKEDLNTINKSLADSFDSFKATLKDLYDSNAEINARINKLEGVNSGRKSFTNRSSPQRLEKSEDGFKDANTFNVANQTDLNRLTDRLMGEHSILIQKGNTSSAAMLEATINEIEINKSVPVSAYRQLAQMNIKLVADQVSVTPKHLFQTKYKRSFKEIFGTT